MANYDVLGNVIIVKFPEGTKSAEKKRVGRKLLESHKAVKTVLEKTERFKGRLRTLKTKFIAGEKTKEVLYKENDCVFRFNVDTCYFSPRLSTDRLEIANFVKKLEHVLVMFGGVAPYAMVIARKSKAEEIVSVELSKECNKYAVENVKRNKVSNVKIVQGDVRKVVPKFVNAKKSKIFGASKTESFQGFDRIVMARPNLKDSFLDVAFKAIKKGGIIHYHGFYRVNDVEENHILQDLIDREARKARKKVKILRIKRAGDIAPYKFRYRVDFKVMN